MGLKVNSFTTWCKEPSKPANTQHIACSQYQATQKPSSDSIVDQQNHNKMNEQIIATKEVKKDWIFVEITSQLK